MNLYRVYKNKYFSTWYPLEQITKTLTNQISTIPLLVGIKIGEIGTKLGMNATNNGFLGFDNVRIPRDHMLMKNSQVTNEKEIIFLIVPLLIVPRTFELRTKEKINIFIFCSYVRLQILEDGTYIKATSDKLTYGTMMFVRVVLLQDIASYISKAVTIAIRYSAVRRQSQIKSE